MLSFQCLITRGNTWPHCVTYSTKCKRPTPPVRAECSLFRCCVSPLPTAFTRLPGRLFLAASLGDDQLRCFVTLCPTACSRIGMCSSVHYGLIVDIHEVITCCRFSLHSILLLNIALISGKEHQHTCVFTIFHTTILYSVLMHVLLPHQYL